MMGEICRVLSGSLWMKIWKISLEPALTTLTDVLCHEVCQCCQFPTLRMKTVCVWKESTSYQM